MLPISWVNLEVLGLALSRVEGGGSKEGGRRRAAISYVCVSLSILSPLKRPSPQGQVWRDAMSVSVRTFCVPRNGFPVRPPLIFSFEFEKDVDQINKCIFTHIYDTSVLGAKIQRKR